jgi:hypothetical protein
MKGAIQKLSVGSLTRFIDWNDIERLCVHMSARKIDKRTILTRLVLVKQYRTTCSIEENSRTNHLAHHQILQLSN